MENFSVEQLHNRESKKSEILRKLKEESSSGKYIKLEEAKILGKEIGEDFKLPEEIKEFILVSPDTVDYFIIENLSSLEIRDLVENLSNHLRESISELERASEKFHKNHEPNKTLLQEAASVLNEVPEDLEIKESVIGEVAGRVVLIKKVINMLEEEKNFYIKISEHIKNRTPYYHVSSIEESEVAEGSNINLNPGEGAAWGRGIYASEKPLLSYLGGETVQKKMGSCAIFAFPVDENCIFNYGSAEGTTGKLINVNTNNRNIKFEGLRKTQISREQLQQLNALGLERLPLDVKFFLVSADKIYLTEKESEGKEN